MTLIDYITQAQACGATVIVFRPGINRVALSGAKHHVDVQGDDVTDAATMALEAFRAKAGVEKRLAGSFGERQTQPGQCKACDQPEAYPRGGFCSADCAARYYDERV